MYVSIILSSLPGLCGSEDFFCFQPTHSHVSSFVNIQLFLLACTSNGVKPRKSTFFSVSFTLFFLLIPIRAVGSRTCSLLPFPPFEASSHNGFRLFTDTHTHTHGSFCTQLLVQACCVYTYNQYT